jgi:hypothetical protein
MFICCRLTTDWLLLAVQVCNTLWFVYILCSEVKHVGVLTRACQNLFTRACQNLFIFLFAVPGTLTQPSGRALVPWLDIQRSV